MNVRWLADTRDDAGNVLFRMGRDGETRLAEWPGLARLRYTPGREPELLAEEGADPALFTKVQKGIARALVRSLNGAITLHASAIASRGCAVLCLGASGAGKSTMAASLCARDGFALLADDMCEVRWHEEDAALAFSPFLERAPRGSALRRVQPTRSRWLSAPRRKSRMSWPWSA